MNAMRKTLFYRAMASSAINRAKHIGSFEETCLKIKNSLNGSVSKLPGEAVHAEMLPGMARNRLLASDLRRKGLNQFRESAVLILLYPNSVLENTRHQENISDSSHSTSFVLTKRHSYKGAHSGQICLPGGSVDETDASLEETAARETFEELGIEMDQIDILGQLSEVYVPVSNFIIAPFVGKVNVEEVKFEPHPREVDYVLSTPIDHLLKDDIIKTKAMTFSRSGSKLDLDVPYFDIEGEVVWGATAAILNEFKHILLNIQTKE